MVASVSGGTTPTQRTITLITPSVLTGATTVNLRGSIAGIVLPVGTCLSFFNTGTNRRVFVQLLHTSPVTLPVTADSPSFIAVSCAPLQYAIAANRTAIWFDNLKPVRGLINFDWNVNSQETDLTGTDTPTGTVTGRTRAGITASCEFFERPSDAGGALVLGAVNAVTDTTENLWTVFTRSDGKISHGLALFSNNGDPISVNGYARHSFTVAFQANTFTELELQEYT